MKIKIITVGKQSSPALTSLYDEYLKRLRGNGIEVSWDLVAPAKGGESLPIPSIINIESLSIIKHLPPRSYHIVLDERGDQFTTNELAQKLETAAQTTNELCFVIGGAYGFDDTVRQRADIVWSLSKLTFPHQLVRLLLAEQLYRAYSILGGGKYHHD